MVTWIEKNGGVGGTMGIVMMVGLVGALNGVRSREIMVNAIRMQEWHEFYVFTTPVGFKLFNGC